MIIIEAWKLTGYYIGEVEFTKSVFTLFQKENPLITLDEAILKFENAPIGVTLKQFAISKSRNEESYRNTYRCYFNLH